MYHYKWPDSIAVSFSPCRFHLLPHHMLQLESTCVLSSLDQHWVRVGPRLVSCWQSMCCWEECNNLLCLLLRKWLHKLASISLAWVLFCLWNLDAMFMQSGPFMVLNSLQLEGCASNNIRWSLMLLFALSLVSHKRSSPLAVHFQESCHFLFAFSFSYARFAFLFPLRCFFCWRLIAV